MKPKIQLFHFTRTPGVVKINDIEKCEMFLPKQEKRSLIFYFLTHYQYLEKQNKFAIKL